MPKWSAHKSDPVRRLAGAAQDLAALKLVSHPDRKLVRVVTIVGGRDRAYVDLNAEQLDELISTLSAHRWRLLP